MYSTNYRDTFIAVAADCGLSAAARPPEKSPETAAQIIYALASAAPYRYTSDELLYAVQGRRRGLSREEFFAKPRACLRACALGKRYGWGIHCDARGRVALCALGSPEYERLAADPALRQLRALSTRAKKARRE